MKKVKIGNLIFGNGWKPIVIAEAGINHNGEFDKAKQLVDAAADAGADVIKFQTHLADYEMLKSGPTAEYVGGSLYDLIKSIELTKSQHKKLMFHAQKRGILFLSTPFSREAVDLLESIDIPAYKIGSGELTNFPLLGYIAGKKKPMIISTGMSTLKEIEQAIDFVTKINKKIVILHCTSTYPTRYKNVRLPLLPKHMEAFKCPVGLSDHSQGIYTALGAVALGVCCVEKHFTISRAWPGPDQTVSIEPHELRELVLGCDAVYQAMSSDNKIVLKAEKEVQKMARESIVTLRAIKRGEKFSLRNIWVKRPGTGIPANQLFEVIGRVSKSDIPADTIISQKDIL